MIQINSQVLLQEVRQPVLEKVTAKITEILNSRGFMQEVLRYLSNKKGKMIRPLLVQLCASLCGGGVFEDIVDVAAGIELLHMASLVHDDIIDHSDLRRGQATLNNLYGASVAVLAGDFLFAKAFKLFTKHKGYNLIPTMTDVVCRMCEGEVNQLVDPVKEEAEYWDYIYDKTACLLGAACRVGGLLASSERLDDLEKLGVLLGYAFQMTDDVLDYYGDPDILGKRVGDDHAEGIWTLPLIKAKELGVLTSDWKNLSFKELRKIIIENDIHSMIAMDVTNILSQAKQILNSFLIETQEQQKAKQALTEIADYILSRNN